jgi:hypothetical protein
MGSRSARPNYRTPEKSLDRSPEVALERTPELALDPGQQACRYVGLAGEPIQHPTCGGNVPGTELDAGPSTGLVTGPSTGIDAGGTASPAKRSESGTLIRRSYVQSGDRRGAKDNRANRQGKLRGGEPVPRVDPEGRKNPGGERETSEQSGAPVAERVTDAVRRSSPSVRADEVGSAVLNGSGKRLAWRRRYRSGTLTSGRECLKGYARAGRAKDRIENPASTGSSRRRDSEH